jgi:beta-barrel assembly-enhancing protease
VMSEAGFDPRALLGVMKILEEASGGKRQSEFMSSHPNPGNRQQVIEAAIEKLYPNGVPRGLTNGAELRRARAATAE